jgi:Rps23 Pro-64 3,4-dihydroxylase Tpa1-like proline 4-hydroxylase
MTAKQILDSFSEALMQDERILSPQERELLLSLLQNAKALSSSNPETQSAVTATIARSVGETVAQRAFVVLGGNIVERIATQSGISAGREETISATANEAGGPEPPSSAPQPPGVRQPPQKDHPKPEPQRGPEPPSPAAPSVRRPPSKDQPVGPEPPSAPQPPSQGLRRVSMHPKAHQRQPDSGSGVDVLDAPVVVRAQCVVLDEFLAPQEIEELIQYALQREAEFQTSAVISPSGDPGVVDYQHRRSRVLMDLGKHQEVMLERIRWVLPRVLEQLGVEEFPAAQVEAQITASNDGDFFHEHCDDAQDVIASRRVTFVYFFHREPRRFHGGELRLHDTRRKGEQPFTGNDQTGGYQTIVPQQNQIVFFLCSVLHEITPVENPSQAFADSRFTLNGWLHE